MRTITQKQVLRENLEVRLLCERIEFEQTFLLVKSLAEDMDSDVFSITTQTVDALLSVIQSSRHENQKQFFFLCRTAAGTLIDIASDPEHPLSLVIIDRLQHLLTTSLGRRRRAVSQALGALPLNICGPEIPIPENLEILELDFQTLPHLRAFSKNGRFQWKGRTLCVNIGNDSVCCIKFSRSEKDLHPLFMETQWQCYLKKTAAGNTLGDAHPFHVPHPFRKNDCVLFRLQNIPEKIISEKKELCLHPAIIFYTPSAYYAYPNDGPALDLDRHEILTIFSKNAAMLGTLAAEGIIHTALIPLFHNRVQQSRRQDSGLYLWEMGGRLDKWLESCLYPNFSCSGIRDFEHLISINNSSRLHHFIGEHLLGFILVIGSFFRFQHPERIGLTENNEPVDVRHFFDPGFFYEILTSVVTSYYEGLTGLPGRCAEKLIDSQLVDALIDNMGKDRFMEEILRVQDQKDMDDNQFAAFLRSRGLDETEIAEMEKNKTDIRLNTGPHLGGFSQPISVPELIECLFNLSSMCIADRYLSENALKGQVN